MKKKTKSHFHVDFMSGDGDNFPQQNGFVKGGCNYVVDRIHTLNTLENGGLFSDFSKYWTCLHRHNATKYGFENRQLLTKTTSKVVYFIVLRYWGNEH